MNWITRSASLPGVCMQSTRGHDAGMPFTPADEQAIVAALDAELAPLQRAMPAAYHFFVAGEHRFRRDLEHLDPTPRPCAVERVAPSIALDDDLHVAIVVKADTPSTPMQRLPIAFLLAQTERPAFFASLPADTLFSDPRHFAWICSRPLDMVSKLVVFAMHEPTRWAELLRSSPDQGQDGASCLALLRALDHVVHGQPIGRATIDDALNVRDPRPPLYFLGEIAADADRADLKAAASAVVTDKYIDELLR